jgi:hypothetical protein
VRTKCPRLRSRIHWSLAHLIPPRGNRLASRRAPRPRIHTWRDVRVYSRQGQSPRSVRSETIEQILQLRSTRLRFLRNCDVGSASFWRVGSSIPNCLPLSDNAVWLQVGFPSLGLSSSFSNSSDGTVAFRRSSRSQWRNLRFRDSWAYYICKESNIVGMDRSQG